MRVARLLLTAVLLALLPAGSAAASPGPVVVVGVAGLRWDDVGPDTPALTRLAGTAAVGVLSVKAQPAVSCLADGWLTLGAGARAQAQPEPRTPCTSELALDASVGTRNAASRDAPRLFALPEALDGRVQPVGPAARLAAGPSAAPGAGVRLVDGGAVGGTGPARRAAAREVDARVAREVAGLPSGGTLLVVGLSEAAGDDTAHLHVALASGPSFPRGGLRSASTRRTPYVQLIDVAPTVLELAGAPVPEVMDGQPWTVAGAAPTVRRLRELDVAAVVGKQVTVPFFVVLIGAQLVLLVALRRRLQLVALAGTAAPGAAYAAQLVPWERTGAPLPALLAVVLALSAGAALVVRRTAHPVGLLCAGTAGLLAVDLVTGAHLQIDSVAGYSSLVAGRFAGIGNVAFGVYATTALLATASLASGRRRAGLLVAGAALVAVAVDGAPPWGSDVGGVLALVPASAVLGLLLTGRRVSPSRLAAAAGAAAGTVTVLALADAARAPADRTHLGRFVGQVRDGTAGELLRRKAEAVFGLLFHSPVTAALPLVVAAAVALVLRPPPPLRDALEHVPGLRPGLVAVAVACALGFALNDSGAAVPALALLVLVPAVLAVLARPGQLGEPPR